MRSIFLAAALALVAPQLPDGAALLKSLRQPQNEAYARQQKGEKVDLDAVKAEVKAKALEAIVNVDPTKVPDGDADTWSEVFRLAGRTDDAVALAEKSIRLHATKAWSQQCALLPDYLEKGDKEKILRTLDSAASVQINMVGQMGEFVIYGLTPKYVSSDPQFVLKSFDILLRRVNPDRPLDKDEQYWMKFAYARLSAHRDAVLYQTGKTQEALADLKKVRTTVQADAKAVGAVDEVLNQLSITDKAAPEIVADRKIGAYQGLTALRGKVVLLDFFAHWCGPCKRAFPAMRDLYTAAKPRGLEIVGVTSLQGYYADQQGVKPEAEFALMRDKFVPEFKLPWPIAFEKDKSATGAYGVSVIPQLVVIDRKGKVRRIVVGYTPAEFAETKAFVEKLLAEK